MNKNIFIEASGSIVSHWLIKAIKNNGDYAFASDIMPDCAARHLADDYLIVPRHNDTDLWEKIEQILIDKHINIVIPSFDETLSGWAERNVYFKEKIGVDVIISPIETINTCQDKFSTFNFFKSIGIPTPKTSLSPEYRLVKPRFGRGGKGVRLLEDYEINNIKIDGLISQELLIGEEHTIDCFVDKDCQPVYIVPRKRLDVKEGKSLNGITIDDSNIQKYVHTICKSLQFAGPINIQCFSTKEGIFFTEINPRVGGGMALGFAATENWINLIETNLIENIEITDIKSTAYGLKMMRYYEEIFI